MVPVTVGRRPEPDDVAILCARCRREHTLFVRVGADGMACPGSSLIPMEAASDAEILQAENRIRDTMTRRGGPDRHMVRSGRT